MNDRTATHCEIKSTILNVLHQCDLQKLQLYVLLLSQVFFPTLLDKGELKTFESPSEDLKH